MKMQKYSVKIRIDSITLHHATWEDKILSSLEEAIAYYMKLHPKKPIEIWIGESLVWRSPAAVAIKNQNQFTLF
tara:strand:- start:230 stop:451 length:222 start_codon:yes stop_codon:yes gene_type:complete